MRSWFPLLYWFGLVGVLIGIGLRFWSAHYELGLAVALIGVASMIAGRLMLRLTRSREKHARV